MFDIFISLTSPRSTLCNIDSDLIWLKQKVITSDESLASFTTHYATNCGRTASGTELLQLKYTQNRKQGVEHALSAKCKEEDAEKDHLVGDSLKTIMSCFCCCCWYCWCILQFPLTFKPTSTQSNLNSDCDGTIRRRRKEKNCKMALVLLWCLWYKVIIDKLTATWSFL